MSGSLRGTFQRPAQRHEQEPAEFAWRTGARARIQCKETTTTRAVSGNEASVEVRQRGNRTRISSTNKLVQSDRGIQPGEGEKEINERQERGWRREANSVREPAVRTDRTPPAHHVDIATLKVLPLVVLLRHRNLRQPQVPGPQRRWAPPGLMHPCAS